MTFARVVRSKAMRFPTVALLATALLAAGADTLVTAAPGARNLTADGGYQA